MKSVLSRFRRFWCQILSWKWVLVSKKWQISGMVAISCQKLPSVAKSCHRLPKVAIRCYQDYNNDLLQLWVLGMEAAESIERWFLDLLHKIDIICVRLWAFFDQDRVYIFVFSLFWQILPLMRVWEAAESGEGSVTIKTRLLLILSHFSDIFVQNWCNWVHIVGFEYWPQWIQVKNNSTFTPPHFTATSLICRTKLK